MSKIVCGISGGIDSAVAALLLKRRGYNVIGAFMKNWDLIDEKGHCSTEEDREYAARVCDVLKIPFYEINFVKEYWNHVFQHTMEEYEAGRTPNPDVLCNRYIKFDAFIKHACETLEADYIATGHYARTNKDFCQRQCSELSKVISNSCDSTCPSNSLYQAIDQNKDQTFFLHKISSSALQKTLFPVGGLHKSTVISIGKENSLGFVSQRKESMGICFIGSRDFSNFILEYISPKSGRFICLESGKMLGNHQGYFMYTIGQRARIGGGSLAYFVSYKDISSGDVFVCSGSHHPSLYSRSIIIDNPHWINGIPESLSTSHSFECSFRFMHREPLVNCTLYSIGNSRYLVVLSIPLRALTEGQSAVFYSQNICLGGATIMSIGPSLYECKESELCLIPQRTDISQWQEMHNTYGNAILPHDSNVMEHIIEYQDRVKIIKS